MHLTVPSKSKYIARTHIWINIWTLALTILWITILELSVRYITGRTLLSTTILTDWQRSPMLKAPSLNVDIPSGLLTQQIIPSKESSPCADERRMFVWKFRGMENILCWDQKFQTLNHYSLYFFCLILMCPNVFPLLLRLGLCNIIIYYNS